MLDRSMADPPAKSLILAYAAEAILVPEIGWKGVFEMMVVVKGHYVVARVQSLVFTGGWGRGRGRRMPSRESQVGRTFPGGFLQKGLN
jgi:hypothetical protein